MSRKMSKETVDAIVVGGGQAGIMLSHYLKLRGVTHLVLERDRAFSAWRNRWEGFRTNTPNWMNTLPVLPPGQVPSDDPKAFGTRDEMIAYLDECLAVVAPPIRTSTNVRSVSLPESGVWEVVTDDTAYRANCVALCHGAMSKPRVPVAANEIPDSVAQLHSSEYQRPEQIETRSVLIVGSASSGVQIARLLGESGRFEQLNISGSDVTVLPERILGIQTHRFIHRLGLFDVRSRSPLGRLMYSGLERRGDPIMRPTPKDLSRIHGVRLFARFEGIQGTVLRFADNQRLRTDDLTVIWCTGFQGDYSMLDDTDEVLDHDGAPIHERGVAREKSGLFFVGLRHQHTVASHDIYGVAKDAEFIADRIRERLDDPVGANTSVGQNGEDSRGKE